MSVRGTLHGVAWAEDVDEVVALAVGADGATHALRFDPSGHVQRAGRDLAGQPLCDVDVPPDARVTACSITREAAAWRAALLRAAQIAGALAAVAQLTQRYVGEREQFGRPIGSQQAVQLHVVAIAQAAELAAMSVWRASRAATAGGQASFEACAAKLLCDESARVAVRSAHQAHGAIGMTREYPLHLLTRRLNAWRSEFGTEQQLAPALGSAVAKAGSFGRILSDAQNGVLVPWPTT